MFGHVMKMVKNRMDRRSLQRIETERRTAIKLKVLIRDYM